MAKFVSVILMTIWLSASVTFAQSDCECECCDTGWCAGIKNQPDDPWTRGRIWLRQTGHFGLFYNCDCEEMKRCSPYICWKKSDSPFSGENFRDDIRCDILAIKQRIFDGSKDCCGNRKRKTPARSCHCDNCRKPSLLRDQRQF